VLHGEYPIPAGGAGKNSINTKRSLDACIDDPSKKKKVSKASISNNSCESNKVTRSSIPATKKA
jgi:hypothetical protein